MNESEVTDSVGNPGRSVNRQRVRPGTPEMVE